MNIYRRMRESLQSNKRRLRLWLNRFRLFYRIRKKGRLFALIIPSRHQSKIRYAKYIISIFGLLSAFIVFQSVWYSFLLGLFLFLLFWLLENTFFTHPQMFIHALPIFELDPNRWVGVGFGYFRSATGEFSDIPLVTMLVTDEEYAHNLHGLFLDWTKGDYNDVDRNISISVVVTGEDEYVFFCYPNLRRPIARAVFDKARQDLRKTSLEDVITELHGLLVLGKHCPVSPSSYFPTFRRRFQPGTPVHFGFLLPPFGSNNLCADLKTFVVHDFSIKQKDNLTRKDLEYGLLEAKLKDLKNHINDPN